MLNSDFNDRIELHLEKLAYKLRWNHKLKENSSDVYKISFNRTIVTLHPMMRKDLELHLFSFKIDLLKVIKVEGHKLKASTKYKTFRKRLRDEKQFLRENNLRVVPSDKTNRCCG